MNWMEVVQNVGTFALGSISFSAVLAYVSKSVLNNWINKSLEKYKSELTRQSELHKYELQRITNEHQIRFSKLHNDRAAVIKDLYAKLVKMDVSISEFMNPLWLVGQPTKEELGEIAVKEVNSFIAYYNENRIFFDKRVCDLVDQIIREVRAAWHEFTFFRVYSTQDQGDGVNKLEKWDKAWNTISTVIPNIKRELEEEFRSLLGVL